MTETSPGIELLAIDHLCLVKGEAPELSPEHAAARDRVWEAATRTNPALFDGPVVACAELRREGPHALLLRWAPVTYRHYALRRVPGARALPSLFVNAMQPVEDGRVLVVRMAAWTAAPGRWQLPGGSVEPPEGEVLDEAALRQQAAHELAEELGVEVKADALRSWAVTRGENSSVGLTYLAPALPAEELYARFDAVGAAERAQGRQPELDEVVLVRSAAELDTLASPHADYLAPLLRRFAEERYGA